MIRNNFTAAQGRLRLGFFDLTSLGSFTENVTYISFAPRTSGHRAVVGFASNNTAFAAPIPHEGWSDANRISAVRIYNLASIVAADTASLDDFDGTQRRAMVASHLAIQVWKDGLSGAMKVSLVLRPNYEHLLLTA